MAHLLDRPAWSALTGPHAALAEGGALARRYRPGTVPFAAARDDSAEALGALAALPAPGEVMALVEAGPLTLPDELEVVRTGRVVQMVLEDLPRSQPDGRIVRLTRADAEEMLALATLTEPGPFTLNVQDLGDFYGVRENGQLVAMAGQRMRQVGFAELSGVCSHPSVRGRGLARLLSVFVTHLIVARGETPYLHAWAENAAAIRLYETIGFRLRTPMNLAAVRRAE